MRQSILKANIEQSAHVTWCLDAEGGQEVRQVCDLTGGQQQVETPDFTVQLKLRGNSNQLKRKVILISCSALMKLLHSWWSKMIWSIWSHWFRRFMIMLKIFPFSLHFYCAHKPWAQAAFHSVWFWPSSLWIQSIVQSAEARGASGWDVMIEGHRSHYHLYHFHPSYPSPCCSPCHQNELPPKLMNWKSLSIITLCLP